MVEMVNPSKRDPGILDRGDSIAEDLLNWLEPLRFAEATDERDREAAYHLRYKAVLDEGMEDPARFPERMERDEYDANAVQILGWDETGPIATCRLVLPILDCRLPFEEVFGPLTRAVGPAVEWGRVTVDSSLRGEGGRIIMGLTACGWLAMRARGMSTAIGVTPRRLVRLFRTLGFPLVVLGESRLYWGEERVPVLCDGLMAVQTLEHLWHVRDQEQLL